MISQTIRRSSFAATAAVFIAGSLQAATIGTDGWTRVAPLGGNFSVSMPGVPDHKTSPLYSNGVTSTLHTYLVDSGSYTYAVFYNDLPAAPASLRQRLDNMRNACARDGRLIDEKEFTFSGYRGKAITVEKEGYTLYTRFFVANKRV